MKPTLYIDCTQTYATEVMTGIPRVVRHIVHEATQNDFDDIPYDIQPMILVGDAFYPIERLPSLELQRASDTTTRSSRMRHLISAMGLAQLLARLVRGLMRVRVFEDTKNRFRQRFPRAWGWLKAQYVHLKFALQRTTTDTCAPLNFQKGDVLFMLDSSWNAPVWSALESAHKQQARIIFAVYDLIPLLYPQFCDEGTIRRYRDYYSRAVKVASGFMAISSTVMAEARHHFSQIAPPGRSLRFDYFYLGADFQADTVERPVRAKLAEVFSQKAAVYLMVSTLEPRKNHAYLLDAFEQLWAEGSNVKLLIVGRVGWKVGPLMNRLNTHPQRHRKLYLFHDLTDAELSYAYTHARALVFPSIAEGFGLPLIEAFQHGLPVIASDIPVHREICGRLAYYVALDDPASLARQVRAIEMHGIAPEHQPSTAYQWLSWREATHHLLQKILRMVNTSEHTP